MKNVLILGATGRTGKLVLKELAKTPSIQLIAALRKASDRQRLEELNANFETVLLDISNPKSLKEAVEGTDIIIQAIRLREDIPEDALITLNQRIRQAAGKDCLIITVGGAGSLRLKNGIRFWQSPAFPQQTLPRGAAHARLRDYLEQVEISKDWAYLIPPPVYLPNNPKTGKYRTYSPAAQEDSFTQTRISYADFAAALADAVRQEWKGTYLVAET